MSKVRITPEISALLKHLCRTYPAAFRPEAQAPLPLAHGIHWQILNAVHPDVHPMTVKGALTVYTCRPEYQACLKPGATRVNLKGEAAGAVDAPRSPESVEFKISSTKPKPENANNPMKTMT